MNGADEIWVDAQLSPSLAPWIIEKFDVQARSVKWLGLRDASDEQIFEAARAAEAIVMTKDADFVRLLASHGAPPYVVWLTFGNTTNARVRQVLEHTLESALRLIQSGEALVEIGSPEFGAG